MINTKDTRLLYRNIYYENKLFKIRKNKEHILTSEDLKEALYLRDLLEINDWDISSVLEINLENNPYNDCNLPDFPNKRKNGRIKGISNNASSNIYHRLKPYEEYYIRKSVNKHRIDYGTYKSLVEALMVREELIKVDWDKNCLKSIQENVKKELII